MKPTQAEDQKLGVRLRRLRKERGMRIDQVPGVKRSTLSHIETGTTYPNLKTLEALARAYHVLFIVGDDGIEIHERTD